MRSGEPRFPLLVAALAQAIGVGLAFALLLALAQVAAWRPSVWGAASLQGVLAATAGAWLGLSRWWLPLNAGFVPALLAVHMLALPAWSYALAFFMVLLSNWNSFGERVPLYLSGRPTERALQRLLEARGAPFAFVDLGCGLGGTLVRLARRFPESRFEGVETAPLSFAIAWLRSLGQRNCRVRLRDLWKQDLGGYDVVYCFLSPAPMAALWEKARRQMRPGSTLVSNSFAIPGVAATAEVRVDDLRGSRLLLWSMSHDEARASG